MAPTQYARQMRGSKVAFLSIASRTTARLRWPRRQHAGKRPFPKWVDHKIIVTLPIEVGLVLTAHSYQVARL